MKNFCDLLSKTMTCGQDQFNTRTGQVCRAVVGVDIHHDSAAGFPATTTKKLHFKGVVGELLGFFRGCDNAADFEALGCNVWGKNANETAAWLQNPARRGHNDLGRIYSKQWTEWRDTRVIAASETHRYLQRGFQIVGQGIGAERSSVVIVQRTINQLEEALRKLITDPSDRRIIVSAWNPGEIDLMALPPCHMDYRFVAFDGPTPEAPKTLHVVMTIRSWDLFLGAPFNIASTALFLAIMARLAGMTPGQVTIQATNAHIYETHYEQVREQLTREPLPLPRLVLSERIRPVISAADIPGVFARIEPADIALADYQSHAAIKAEMAA